MLSLVSFRDELNSDALLSRDVFLWQQRDAMTADGHLCGRIPVRSDAQLRRRSATWQYSEFRTTSSISCSSSIVTVQGGKQLHLTSCVHRLLDCICRFYWDMATYWL